MRKLLMSSIVLFLFAASVTLVQVSCSKSNAFNAKTNALGRMLYSTQGSSGIKVWLADYDGSNATEINLALPANVSIDVTNLQNMMLSPDGTKLFFVGWDNTLPQPKAIYSSDINGSNVIKVVADTLIRIQGLY